MAFDSQHRPGSRHAAALRRDRGDDGFPHQLRLGGGQLGDAQRPLDEIVLFALDLEIEKPYRAGCLRAAARAGVAI